MPSAPLTSPTNRNVRELFGVPIDALTMTEVLDRVEHTIATRGRLNIGVVNAAKIVNMRRDDLLRRSVLDSDAILADGMAVVWAARMLGAPLPERVPGIDLMHGMLRRGSERGYRVYCFGATQEVLDVVAAKMESQYPGVVLAGRRNGYFDADEEPAIVQAIRDSRPDILLVAISPPKKEIFLGRWAKELDVPVTHGVGGAFDVLAGKTRRAPERWQRWGLEWLYRIKEEPRRMWKRYLVTNTLFCGMVLGQVFSRRPSPAQEAR